MSRQADSAAEVSVRPFVRDDIPELLRLMKQLARVEEYDAVFAVSERDIEERGLGEHAQFQALVAEMKGRQGLVGMTVVYTVPYTFTLRPDLVLKEFLVDERVRGMGIGSALFLAVKAHGSALGCQQMLWKVMKGNTAAEDFYRHLGAGPDEKWENWGICLP